MPPFFLGSTSLPKSLPPPWQGHMEMGNAVSSLRVVSGDASSSHSSLAPMWVSSDRLHFFMNCYRAGPSTSLWSIHLQVAEQKSEPTSCRIHTKGRLGNNVCFENDGWPTLLRNILIYGQTLIVLKLDFGQLERNFFPCHPKRSKPEYIIGKFHSCFPVPCRCGSANILNWKSLFTFENVADKTNIG